jgi:hypothetical protein
LRLQDGIWKNLIKIIFLGIMDALAIWSALILFNDNAFLLFGG